MNEDLEVKNEDGAKCGKSDLSALLCGCGKPVRYMMGGNFENGSCNKYMRCLTYDELQSTLNGANKLLSAYQVAVNKIDDYFEYANESLKDRKKVHQILGNLTDEIKDT